MEAADFREEVHQLPAEVAQIPLLELPLRPLPRAKVSERDVFQEKIRFTFGTDINNGIQDKLAAEVAQIPLLEVPLRPLPRQCASGSFRTRRGSGTNLVQIWYKYSTYLYQICGSGQRAVHIWRFGNEPIVFH